MDVDKAMSTSEIGKIFELEKLGNRPYLIQGSSGVLGQGVEEGLDWLSAKLNPEKKKNK